LRNENVPHSGLQLGDAFVVFGTHLPVVEGSLPLHVAAIPSAAGSPAPKSAGDQVQRLQDKLVATHCSSALLTCVTASVTVDEARQGEFGAVAGTSGFGCVIGAIAGFLLAAYRRRHRSMEQQLRRSIEKNELKVVYQPIVNLVDGKIVGAEALARWNDRD